MDNVAPALIVDGLTQMGEYKAKLAPKDLIIRGFLSGAILGLATVLAFTVAVQAEMPFLGALAFPAGFAIIIVMGYELVTGSFAAVPMAFLKGRIRLGALARNWTFGFTGNLIGSLFFAVLYYLYATKLGTSFGDPVLQRVVDVAESKTLAYSVQGAPGYLVVFIKALLCNWMVTMGVVMSLSSSSTLGKIFALWLPIFTFFALGLEHAVVNMFVIPAGILLSADISVTDWWVWNQLPVTLGNIVGALLLTTLPLYLTYARRGGGPTGGAVR